MKLSLRRKFKGSKYTIGYLSIDGTFFCNTIEDVIRELPDSCPNTSRWIPCKCKEKVYARTAIPTGTYKVTLEYSPKFKRKMPYLHSVPHFLGILIHWGNTEDDSGGCIIVGENSVKGKVLNFTGRLFSSEHNRWFTTENTLLQILRDNDKRLPLTANRIPIGQWFNEQYDKLRQSLRQPIQPKKAEE